MEKSTPGLRKRQQIKQANKTMFIWIAGVSVVIGFSVVLALFLMQKILFDEKVIIEKNKTVSVLEKNLKNVAALKEEIAVMNTNQDLRSTRLNESDPPIQSVLDALPADANSTALASSLQTKLLSGVPGIVVETINVEPVSGLETAGTDASSGAGANTGTNQINYTFSVSTDLGNDKALRQVLERLEKSIRPFNITAIDVEVQGKRVVMTVKGVSYYEPAKTIQLTQRVVKP